MTNISSKKDIVKMILKNKNIEYEDEDNLMEMLFNESLSLNIDKNMKEDATFFEKLADNITSIVGSWKFILFFSLILILWMIINLYLEVNAYDPYPFILLNLFLSCFSSLQAPIILISQNRSAKRDSIRSKNDYIIDLKSELLLEEICDNIKVIINNQNKILKLLNDDRGEI